VRTDGKIPRQSVSKEKGVQHASYIYEGLYLLCEGMVLVWFAAKVMVVGPSCQTEWKTIESDSKTPVGRAVDAATSARTTLGRVRNELSLDSRRLGVQLECECSVSL
jgi:hypothetical protein